MTSIELKTMEAKHASAWDSYVRNHQRATLYHLSGWKTVLERTYGHMTYYLMAVREQEDDSQLGTRSPEKRDSSSELIASSYELNPGNIAGVLPLVHLKHSILVNSLVSIPFFDLGGMLSDDSQMEKLLLEGAIELAQELKAKNIELRHIEPMFGLADNENEKSMTYELSARNCAFQTRSHKVRMLLELPASSEVLMKSFKSKLRSQIKKPLKEGLKAKVGGVELLKDFFEVFSINMRDLGSPVHSKELMRNVLGEFTDQARIVMVYSQDQPVACSLIVGFRDTLENPWASALREFSRLSPNMLLYWSMLEYACNNGYAYFDFGRSSPDEGTYRFKAQWGAKPQPLHWHYVWLDDEPGDMMTSEKSKFDKAIRYWQKLPVSVTKVIGPRIRKYIGL